MIHYRPFHNTDPPRLVGLWRACELGRGAAAGFGPDAFETLCFSQPYFDSRGLIVACEGDDVLGYVHAGFAANRDRSALDKSTGVICAVMVRPDDRRRGMGRTLLERAEEYLRSQGTEEILAGPHEPADPFYVGLYGGSRPSGFLESDPAAGPFFAAMGYEPASRHGVYQRDIAGEREPVSFRLITIRRKTELRVLDRPRRATWWWMTRFGRLDSIRFELVPKGGGDALAALTVVGLDLYLDKWNERAAGLIDLQVPRAQRRQGYGQALVLEVCRRLREELVTRVEAHCPEADPIATALLQTSGFHRVDTGIVYRRRNDQ